MGTNDGPTAKLDLSCFECRHMTSISYRVQGDSGRDVYCTHPDALTHPKAKDGRVYIADTCWRTPGWCPLRAEAIRALVARLVPAPAPDGA